MHSRSSTAIKTILAPRVRKSRCRQCCRTNGHRWVAMGSALATGGLPWVVSTGGFFLIGKKKPLGQNWTFSEKSHSADKNLTPLNFFKFVSDACILSVKCFSFFSTLGEVERKSHEILACQFLAFDGYLARFGT